MKKAKSQKSKTQVLFVFPLSTFKGKIRENNENGDEFYYLEEKFFPRISPIPPIQICRFLRKVCQLLEVTVNQPLGVERWLSPFWKAHMTYFQIRQYEGK